MRYTAIGTFFCKFKLFVFTYCDIYVISKSILLHETALIKLKINQFLLQPDFRGRSLSSRSCTLIDIYGMQYFSGQANTCSNFILFSGQKWGKLYINQVECMFLNCRKRTCKYYFLMQISRHHKIIQYMYGVDIILC